MTRAMRRTTGGSGKHVSFVQARVLSVNPFQTDLVTDTVHDKAKIACELCCVMTARVSAVADRGGEA